MLGAAQLDALTNRHRAIVREPEVLDGTRGVVGHGEEQVLAPSAHTGGVARHDCDPREEVRRVVEVAPALEQAQTIR